MSFKGCKNVEIGRVKRDGAKRLSLIVGTRPTNRNFGPLGRPVPGP